MLNISDNNAITDLSIDDFASGKKLLKRTHFKYFNRFLIGFAITLFIILFLPWTQNVSGRGFVTTLTPDQRPQTLQSPIPGRVEQWYVREGDFVNKGDTILRISEVKGEYFDPNIVERTGQQIDSKNAAVKSYQGKVGALDNQIGAIVNERGLKLSQASNKLKQSRLKVTSDSVDLEAAKTNLRIAETRFKRSEALLKEGLKSEQDFEESRLKLRENQSKLVSLEQKLLQSRNEILIAQLEQGRINQEYNEKIAKTQSDQFTAQSSQFDTEAQVSKLETDRQNYSIRQDLYFVTAPQKGYVNKAIVGGLGITFKEGEPLVNIMPADYDLAVETYVDPIDLPLMHINEEVRVQFDGWPAIVFSGWPNASYGTYGAKVVAIDTYITTGTGKYRILLAPDPKDEDWPTALRAGAGATTIALLEDVPIWYELWRKLNGFPPNYYTPESKTSDTKDEKK